MIGQKLGPYTILEIVDYGSLGTVYRAEAPDGKLVALNPDRADSLACPKALAYLSPEQILGESLDHRPGGTISEYADNAGGDKNDSGERFGPARICENVFGNPQVDFGQVPALHANKVLVHLNEKLNVLR